MTGAEHSPSRAPSERRQVTVLFADMAGFTSISERLGEEGTYTLIQPIYELMATAVKEQGGSVREFTGDGIMALFGVPNALEDAPLRACRAALLIQERMSVAAPSIEARHGVRPQMRIGINTGLAVVTQIRGEGANMTALGDTVNLASRLQTLAEPGKVLLSDATNRQVQGLVDATYAGEHEIKGKAEKQKTYRLEALRQGAARFDAAVSRGLTAFVGRSKELETLERQLAASRSGLRVVDVLAEPGMGKSRLLHEFRQKIGKDQVFILQGNCAPDGKQTPFLPFIEIVRGSFRIRAGEAEKDVAEKLEAGLSALGLSTPQNLALLLNLLGLKPPEGSLSGLDGVLIGLRTRELFHSLLAARCAMSPVSMIIEDLHWIDSVSEELLGKIVSGSAGLPLLVVVTRRPEYVPLWLDNSDTSRLTLAPLAATAVGQLVSARLGDAQLPPELAKLIADRAEGNALFAEEIVSFLSERGFLRTNGNRLEYDAAAVASAMPASVQGLLTSRVDRLAPDDRSLLQAASVIGRRFAPELLGAVIPDPGDVQARLDAISRLDLVYPDGRSGDYAFKHALVRDALYQSLLTAPRTALHLEIAEEIERRSGNRFAEVAETLAHHYSQTERHDKAFTYLAMAGAKSLRVYSLEEASSHLGAANTLLVTSPHCATGIEVASFLTNYTLLLNLMMEVRKIVATVDQHMSTLDLLGDNPDSVRILHQRLFGLLHMGCYPEAGAAQLEIEAIADRLGDQRSKAYSFAGRIWLSTLEPPKMSREAFETLRSTALEAAAKSNDSFIQCWLRWVIGFHELGCGHMTKAHDMARELMAVGQELNDPRSAGLGLQLLTWVALTSDNYAEALRYSEQALEVATTNADRASASNGRAISLVLLRLPEGFTALRTIRNECAANGWHWIGYASDAVHGMSIVLQGRIRAGIRFIEGAILERQREGNPTQANWFRLFLSEIYLQIVAGAEQPPLTVLLKNLPTLMYLKLIGPRRIVSQLGEFASQGYDADSHHMGRCEMILGLLYKTKRKRDLALEHLGKAHRSASQFGQTPMLGRIESALAQLQREPSIGSS